MREGAGDGRVCVSGLGRKEGAWKVALLFQWDSLGEASLGSRSQLLACPTSAFSVPVASIKAGWQLLSFRDLCNQDTLGDEEPHSGTTEAGQLYFNLNIKKKYYAGSLRV